MILAHLDWSSCGLGAHHAGSRSSSMVAHSFPARISATVKTSVNSVQPFARFWVMSSSSSSLVFDSACIFITSLAQEMQLDPVYYCQLLNFCPKANCSDDSCDTGAIFIAFVLPFSNIFSCDHIFQGLSNPPHHSCMLLFIAITDPIA